MRFVKLEGTAVTFLEYEGQELVYNRTQFYASEADANVAAKHFLTDYEDYVPFGDDDD